MLDTIRNEWFSETLGGVEISLFNFWHILYLLIIFSVPIAFSFIFRNKTKEFKSKLISGFLIASVSLYALDVFCMAFYRNNIDIDKLPFHICTCISIISCFARFNPFLKRYIQKPAAVLSIVGPLMYLVYPGTALGGISPFSYRLVQTFLYHGTLMTYGVLALSLGEVTLDIKRCWEELAMIVGIALWAGLGNWIYSAQPDGHQYDWLFLTGSTFPFIPKPLMPVAVVFALFAMCMIIYGISYLVKLIDNKTHKCQSKDSCLE